MGTMSVEEVILYVKNILKNFKDWAHSFSHVEAVLSLLDDFFVNVNIEVNKEALYIAAVLHDIGRINGVENHAENSVKIMNSLSLSSKDLIREIIVGHDYPKNKAHEIETLEGKILWDVDNLESNGYIGLIRVQEHAKFLGEDLKWAIKEFMEVWYAKPEHMHFGYTKYLMEKKKEEEIRYLSLLFKKTDRHKTKIDNLGV